MRHFYASAIERRITINGDFATQPVEAGWASEAIFFIWVENFPATANGSLSMEVQISADGINWIDDPGKLLLINAQGHYFLRAAHFGNWIRLNGKTTGDENEIKLSVSVHLKE